MYPDPLVRGMDPDPFITKQLFLLFFGFEKLVEICLFDKLRVRFPVLILLDKGVRKVDARPDCPGRETVRFLSLKLIQRTDCHRNSEQPLGFGFNSRRS
jgi:hypothetical protein